MYEKHGSRCKKIGSQFYFVIFNSLLSKFFTLSVLQTQDHGSVTLFGIQNIDMFNASPLRDAEKAPIRDSRVIPTR